jgi:hypothetical protein
MMEMKFQLFSVHPSLAGLIERTLLLDSGVLAPTLSERCFCFFKTIEKEGLHGGKGD